MNELAAQLKDIHLTAAPGWWPPAPGWWLLSLALTVAVIYLLRRWQNYRRTQRPLQEARSNYVTLYQQFETNQITGLEYIDQCNQLLKRLLIFLDRCTEATSAHGVHWLSTLDKQLNTDEFSNGAGSVLGPIRYQRDFAPDCSRFHQLMCRVLAEYKL